MILPGLRQTAGSVFSSNPAHIAFKTAPLSSFPVSTLQDEATF